MYYLTTQSYTYGNLLFYISIKEIIDVLISVSNISVYNVKDLNCNYWELSENLTNLKQIKIIDATTVVVLLATQQQLKNSVNFNT